MPLWVRSILLQETKGEGPVLCGVMSKLEFLLLANALLPVYTARTTANKQAPAKSTQVSAGQCNH